MVSPGMASCEYTMNTLRYADRYNFNLCCLSYSDRFWIKCVEEAKIWTLCSLFDRVKELNGNSTAHETNKAQEQAESSVEVSCTSNLKPKVMSFFYISLLKRIVGVYRCLIQITVFLKWTKWVPEPTMSFRYCFPVPSCLAMLSF